MKGFKCLYNEVLKPRLELKGVEFVELVPAIERAFTKLGQTMFPSDEERKRAYRAAWKLAEDEQVTIEAIAA